MTTETTNVSELKPQTLEVKMTGALRSLLLQLLDGRPVKKFRDARRTYRLFNLLAEGWDWEELSKNAKIPEEQLKAEFVFDLSKKNKKALSEFIRTTFDEGVFQGRGVRLVAPLYEALTGESFVDDDEEE